MTSYAALLSLIHTLNQIEKHPCPPICLDQSQVDSFTQNLTFFQYFLERHSVEDDGYLSYLESRITAAAYAAEDIIETHIVDQIHARSNFTIVDLCQCLGRVMDLIKKGAMKILGAQILDPIHAGLYRGLERVIGDMDLIRRDMMDIQERIMRPQHHHLHTNSSVPTVSAGPSSTWQSSTTPVLDDVMIYEVLDKLTGQQGSLQIIPIVGMGGIGKTTFARYIYKHSLIIHRFDICAWVTISQEYSVSEILMQVLGQVNKKSEMSEIELGERVHQKLWGRRYFVVMDDIWSTEALEKVRCFFPDNNNGSRIMITTRLSNLELSGSRVFQMKFLDEGKSWGLFCKTVFGNELGCPVELEYIGKKIARNCKGLPLSITVIGGLLKKSKGECDWEYTSQNLNSLINLEDDEYCRQILRTSYKELPIHLKPCFLYMGVFSEDTEINVSHLIKLWVSEGILKPNYDKSFEEVARQYLKDLIDRNLILISELRWDGEAKICKIHDLLRDVCLREAQNHKFLCLVRQQNHHNIPQGINMQRRICIDLENVNQEEYFHEFLHHVVESASLTRSLLCCMRADWDRDTPSTLRLLRVYSSPYKYRGIASNSNDAIFERANLRCLSLELGLDAVTRLHSLFSILWNVETLMVDCLYSTILYPTPPMIPSEIWEMPLLRHVMLSGFVLPDPPYGKHNFILENLQTLSGIINFKLSEEVFKRVPNIKILNLIYRSVGPYDKEEELPDFCLKNLGRLQKLENLHLQVISMYGGARECMRRNLVSFPHSLKKLTLYGTKLKWKDLTIRIGSLPFLQVLKLDSDACMGPKWKTVEGDFISLRVLKISNCYNLKYWYTDSAHFPRLEHLCLEHLKKMEIPSSIGDIPTLKSIRVEYCSKSVVDSAKRIKKEQKENENEDLRVMIVLNMFDSDEYDSDDSDTDTSDEE